MSLRERAIAARKEQKKAEEKRGQQRIAEGEEERSKEVDRYIANLQRLCDEAAEAGRTTVPLIQMDYGTFEEPQHPDTTYTIHSAAYQRFMAAINQIDGARAVIVPEPMNDEGQGRSWTNHWIGASW